MQPAALHTGSKDLYAGGSQPNFFDEHPAVTRWNYQTLAPDVGFDAPCDHSSFEPELHPWWGCTTS
jgi:hypothetical protein